MNAPVPDIEKSRMKRERIQRGWAWHDLVQVSRPTDVRPCFSPLNLRRPDPRGLIDRAPRRRARHARGCELSATHAAISRGPGDLSSVSRGGDGACVLSTLSSVPSRPVGRCLLSWRINNGAVEHSVPDDQTPFL
jgi:hypothetical protein